MAKVQSKEFLRSKPTRNTFPLSTGQNSVHAIPNMEQHTFSLFQPDVLLPTQYLATTRRKNFLEPEKKLMLAVLEDAVWTFQKCLLAQDKKRKSLFGEAKEWIMEENSEWPFSFQNICEVLGLNPKYMRQGLVRWRREALASKRKAQVYRLTSKRNPVGGPRTRGDKLLKAAGY